MPRYFYPPDTAPYLTPGYDNPEYSVTVNDPINGLDGVYAHLGLSEPIDEQTIAQVTQSVGAVNELLFQWFGGDIYYLLLAPGQTIGFYSFDWKPQFIQGAVMLAARLYRRRNSPAGVEAFGEMGPLYVQRNDPDIAMLLGLGSYRRPAVG